MTADADLLNSAVKEAARLLDADGAMIYLVDEESDLLRFAYDAGITDREAQRLIRDLTLPIGVGMFGTAVERRELTITDDYPADERFRHSDVADRIVDAAGMRSMAVAPLVANDRAIGAMGAYSSRPAAFSEAQVALLRALANHSATAIANQRLLAELASRVETQQTLHRLAGRIVSIRDADDVLQEVVDAARRLLGSDGAHLTLRDADQPILRPHVMAGGMDEETKAWLASQEFPMGEGMNGLAAELNEVVCTRDYLVDPRIPHTDDDQAVARRMGLRGMAVAPLRAPGGGVFGTLAVSYQEPRDVGPNETQLLQGLADAAAIAIENARLYGELTASEARLRSQAEELERVVEVQRTLGEIARRIVEVDDSGEILQQVVDASKRLLGSDGAHLTLMNDDGSYLVPMVMAGDTDVATRAWLRGQRFPVGGGINGLAAQTGRPVWTDDYGADPRIPHDPDDDSPGRLELGAAAVAPLRGPGGEVIGTLAITYREPRAVDERDVALLAELAGQGSIAARNARLYEQLRDSERRYRHLVDNSPDLVWSVDADGAFTYLGDSLERMTGFRPEDLIGRSFRTITSPETAAVAEAGWEAVRARPDMEQQVRLLLPLRGGGTIPAEVNMVATTVDGRFAGAHGSARDIRERERLETDLRRQAAELAAGEERANLARELHDSVTQALFSMGLTARALELLLDRDPEAARAKVQELRELQKDALAEMRTLIFELRPQALETDGLAQALRNHASAIQGRTGLDVAAEIDEIGRLGLDVEEALYRIAQEALHNVVKHANAEHARIGLQRTGRVLRLSVEDDGVGFDPDAVPRGHLGLVGMRQRAERIGADLEIVRPPSGGSRIDVRLPLEPTSVE